MARISRNANAEIPTHQRNFTVGAFGITAIVGALFTAALLVAYLHNTRPASPVTSVAEFFAEFPMHFQINRGVFADDVKFFSKGYQYDLLFMDSEVLLNLYSNEHTEPPDASGFKTKLSQISLKFIGGEGESLIKGLHPLALSTNEHKERTGYSPSSFMELKYANVYPGVDVYFHGKQKQLFYEFVLSDAADIGALRMKVLGFNGAGDIDIDEHGNVLVSCRGKKMLIQKPAVYRLVEQQKRPVNGYFFVTDQNEIRFREVTQNQAA